MIQRHPRYCTNMSFIIILLTRRFPSKFTEHLSTGRYRHRLSKLSVLPLTKHPTPHSSGITAAAGLSHAHHQQRFPGCPLISPVRKVKRYKSPHTPFFNTQVRPPILSRAGTPEIASRRLLRVSAWRVVLSAWPFLPSSLTLLL